MRVRIAVLLAATVWGAMQANIAVADPFTFSGPGVSQGDVLQFKYANFEEAVSDVGDVLFGIGYVTSIVNSSFTGPGSDTVWAEGQNGQGELTVTFTDYVVSRVEVLSPDETNFYFTGGRVEFWYDETPNRTFPGSVGNAGDPDGNGTWSDGELFLVLEGAPGIVTTDDAGTAFDETTTTLFSTVSQSSTPFTGDGAGFVNVIGGAFASFFDSDAFDGGTDGFLRNRLEAPPEDNRAREAGWDVESEDPLSLVAIPEPGSLALLATGLLGLGGIRLRRRNGDTEA